MNELKNERIMIILYVDFVQNGITTPKEEKRVKVGWKKINIS